VLTVVDDDEVVSFVVEGGRPLLVAAVAPATPLERVVFTQGSALSLRGMRGLVRVLARVDDPRCAAGASFDAIYDVRSTYPPAALAEGSTAVAKDDPRIRGWATAVAARDVGGGVVQERYDHPDRALGPAEGTSSGVVALGEGGTITLLFRSPIADGDGPDFAVFENAFDDRFLELAFVEVSSDGAHFARFDTAFRGEGPASAGKLNDSTQLAGFAGAFRQGFGTPFDLEALAMHPSVRDGEVDLAHITAVRIVDVCGDGGTVDSFGRPIFDPFPTAAAAGFDLDAVAVLRTRP
jgi:hypothetical protein